MRSSPDSWCHRRLNSDSMVSPLVQPSNWIATQSNYCQYQAISLTTNASTDRRGLLLRGAIELLDDDLGN